MGICAVEVHESLQTVKKEMKEELHRCDYLSDDQAQEKIIAAVKETTDEESALLKAAQDLKADSKDPSELLQLDTPGRIMHFVKEVIYDGLTVGVSMELQDCREQRVKMSDYLCSADALCCHASHFQTFF